MWSREGLKQRGKAVFVQRYWIVVVVAIIWTICTVSGGGNSSNTGTSGGSLANNIPGVSTMQQVPQMISDMQSSGVQGVISHYGARMIAGIFTIFFVMGAIIAFAFKCLILNPILVGVQRFNMENRENGAQPDFGVLLYAFKCGNYMNIVSIMFFRDLFIFLWSLLFVIPGIIKEYEYRMIPYLLAENPNLSRSEAFDFTKIMMTGQKMDAFVLDISFLGWYLLSVITCGILLVFYVRPYVMTTNAELYAAIRNNAVGSGQLPSLALPGFAPRGYNPSSSF